MFEHDICTGCRECGLEARRKGPAEGAQGAAASLRPGRLPAAPAAASRARNSMEAHLMQGGRGHLRGLPVKPRRRAAGRKHRRAQAAPRLRLRARTLVGLPALPQRRLMAPRRRPPALPLQHIRHQDAGNLHSRLTSGLSASSRHAAVCSHSHVLAPGTPRMSYNTASCYKPPGLRASAAHSGRADVQVHAGGLPGKGLGLRRNGSRLRLGRLRLRRRLLRRLHRVPSHAPRRAFPTAPVHHTIRISHEPDRQRNGDRDSQSSAAGQVRDGRVPLAMVQSAETRAAALVTGLFPYPLARRRCRPTLPTPPAAGTGRPGGPAGGRCGAARAGAAPARQGSRLHAKEAGEARILPVMQRGSGAEMPHE